MSCTKAQRIANAKRLKQKHGLRLKGDNFQFVSGEAEKFIETQLAFPKPKSTKGRGCRVSDRDEAAKQRLGYTNPRSYVRLDGSEHLFGGDWKVRKAELGARSGGMCERGVKLGKAHDPLCYGAGGEPHHIKPRSKGRDDRLSNLANLSHACHLAEDERKTRFGEAGAVARHT